MTIDPKQFWEEKLLTWEKGRYDTSDRHSKILERVANRLSNSLRFRLSITPELLRPFIIGKHVLELGCGSGIIAGKLIEYGAASYVGIDIAETAIERAQTRYRGDPRIRFEVAAITDIPNISADIVFSLGLFDWLNDGEIRHVFNKFRTMEFIHAIAERRPGIQQLLHRAYVQLAYGYRTGNYRPRYFLCANLKTLSGTADSRPIYAYRDSRLSFGALISSLPIGEKV